MTEPWFEPTRFGMWWGILGGAVGGSTIGMLGALMGVLLPRGIGRVAFQVIFGILAVLGLVCLAFGLYALSAGQPYGIWYGPVLTGALCTVLCGGAIFLVRAISMQLERRRLHSESLRHS
jgi:hypothetical protein